MSGLAQFSGPTHACALENERNILPVFLHFISEEHGVEHAAKGFVKLLTPSSFAIADMSGNRQYVTLGNAATNPRASLFFMDYPGRRRLKLFAEIEIADRDFAVREQLVERAAMDKVERAMIFHLRGFDWNCPKYITPRWTREELAEFG